MSAYCLGLTTFPGCVGKGEAVCTSILQEKLKLLGQTCTNKYLLLPAIFFFLWQVKTHTLSLYTCPQLSNGKPCFAG